MSGNALVLKFGTDFSEARRQLPALAADVSKNMAAISAVAVGASQTMRNQILASSADVVGNLTKQIATFKNLQTASSIAGEAMKIGFALHHPILALGVQLLGNYKYALGAVAAGALTAVEAVKLISDQLERLNHVVEGSEKAGVSATLFQTWADQAAKVRLSTEEMEKALEHASAVLKPSYDTEGNTEINKFMRLSDQLQNGRKFPTESYQALKDAGDDVDKLQRAGALLVSDFMRAADELGDMRLKAQATQTAIELWGPAGAKLAAALAEGKVSVNDLTRESSEWSHFSENAKTQYIEVNRELAIAKQKLSEEMNPAMEALVRIGLSFQGVWAKIVGLSADAIRNAGQLALTLGRGAIATEIAGMGETSPYGALAKLGASDQNSEAARKLLEKFGSSGGDSLRVPVGSAAFPPSRPSLSELARGGGAGGERAATAARADEVENYIRQLSKQVAALAGEAAAIGKSNTERERMIALAKAEEAARERGTALTDAQREKVLGLAQARAELRAKIDEATKAKEQMRQAEQFFGDAAVTAVDGLIIRHQKLKDVLSDVLKSIEQAALKSLFLGQGPLSGLFGTAGKDGAMGGLFGGLFGMFSTKSAGGVAGTGPFALAPVAAFAGAPHFADGGGIPSILHAGEIVLNAAQQKNVAGAMGQGVTVHNYAGVNVEPRLTQKGVELLITEHMAQGFRAYDSGLVGNLREKQSRQF